MGFSNYAYKQRAIYEYLVSLNGRPATSRDISLAVWGVDCGHYLDQQGKTVRKVISAFIKAVQKMDDLTHKIKHSPRVGNVPATYWAEEK